MEMAKRANAYQQLRWSATPLPHHLHLPLLWRESGSHLLLGKPREFLENPVDKLYFKPKSFSTKSESSHLSTTDN